MKKHLTIFLFLTLFRLVAQTTDSIKRHAVFPDNHYGPFHQTIKDTTQKPVSTFGHYFSVGAGLTKNYGLSGLNELISYSLAYKSLIFSVTYGHNAANKVHNFFDPSYQANYIDLLVGESFRYKHLMVSLSTGIAYSSLFIYNPAIDSVKFYHSQQGTLSVPIELKAFLLARKGIGIGVHLSENIMAPYKYSNFYAGLSLVFGYWNKPKSKN